MTLMLASVASLAEAELAYDCAVDWIDIKDPTRGALGAAPPATVGSIVAFVAARVPVSATIGDCWDTPHVIPARVAQMAEVGVDYVKAGLNARNLSSTSSLALREATAGGAQVIVVCMAENSPSMNDLESLAATGICGVMLDTANKSGASLPQLLQRPYLAEFVECAHGLGLLTGLAGRLSISEVLPLAALGADYLGFRSALCDSGERQKQLSRGATLAVKAAIIGARQQQLETSSEVA
jgi:uncharacterized protein (UPF0264 family)